MNNHTTSITTNKKHHYRELLAIGIPIIIGQLGTIILGFADTLMIGHHSTPELYPRRPSLRWGTGETGHRLYPHLPRMDRKRKEVHTSKGKRVKR